VLFRFLFSVSGSDIPSPDIYGLEHLFIVYVLGDFLLFWLVLGAISGWMFQSSADLRTGLHATLSEGRLPT
jgi:predicted cobalt transporter CbtA